MDQSRPSINIFRVIIKAGILFALFNFAFIPVQSKSLGKISLYNFIFPGRDRLPFGETRESYNLSLYNLDAMFASHVISGSEKARDEYRVILIGDSSVWGTLLTPGQTLAGQLNANRFTVCGGRMVHAYNLGYPTISLMKDLMILDEALKYDPDLIVWLTTLEAFPNDRQLDSPIVANNADRIEHLIADYQLRLNADDPALVKPSKWGQTFVSRRRAVADLVRLQIYGALWASTGIDQVYPEHYTRAQIDLEASQDFHGITSLSESLAFDVLEAGMSAHPSMLLVNEPMLISDGANSDIRYNFFYPRRAYDEYRQLLAERAARNDWRYLDLWNIVPLNEFTNSAIHLTPAGEARLAQRISEEIQTICDE
jgi:hypothetical protein